MAKYSFKYGQGYMDFEYPEENVLKYIEPAHVEVPNTTEEEKVALAIENPIGSAKLEEIIKPGESVCIVVPDTTRLWQKPAVVLKVLVEKLNKMGVKDSDIIMISALGSHRAQTEHELREIVGSDLFDRIKTVDHDCDSNLVHVGTSTIGNDIRLNATAMACDHRILVGGVVYHFLAGFGGGRKTILPGISSRETIMFNHANYFNPGGLGSGKNPNVEVGVYNDKNIVHTDMVEAAKFAKVSFIVNTVIGTDKNVAFCFAGDLEAAHAQAVEKVRSMDGVEVHEAAELAIASACGFPKDINLYQTSKTIINTAGCVKKGDGVMIIASDCNEGWGSQDTEMFALKFDNMLDREKYIRENYTIGMNVAYLEFAFAEEMHFILVTSMDPSLFVKTKVHICKTIDEAIELAKSLTGKTEFKKTYLLPYGANTAVSIK